ncbi:DUF6398 domain-containing protein [Methanoplanus endosymbiosus]|uniref:DUF6398 domain-containing protein n=1 Tax=Methanoplanus endosymbiosus TaxID=33865 RepID=A0A9E7PLA5_9EURY|nr:DUF6398 domain-containing protein [Methanoplanus endosymbiosus]UUX92208.1 DUF6398 domain-containing protein [Methanoplanus endosymbiosus]
MVKDKEAIKEKTELLIEMAAGFCDECLDEEYKELCEKLIRKMSRKRTVPFMTGRMDIWAASIVYALGSINFLFDKNTQPYATADNICDYFGSKKSTTSQKSKIIRDMFKMSYFDDEFSTERMREKNPFNSFVMIDGMVVPKSMLSPELRERIEVIEELKRK